MKIYSKNGLTAQIMKGDLNVPKIVPASGNNKIILKDIIGGKDDRTVFQDSGYPWHLNGYLEYKAGHNGSGILIGKKLVLTCYHCIDFDYGTVIKDFYFIPAKYSSPPTGTKEEPYGRFKVKNAYWWGDGRPTTGTNEFGSMDFAILELDKETGLGYAGSQEFDDSWINKNEWMHIGYPTNNLYSLKDLIKGRPVFQSGIKAIDCKSFDYTDSAGTVWNGRKLFTDADIEGGQSGGAYFKLINNDVYISGVLGAQGSKDTGGAACSSLMTKLITWCRENIDK